MFQFWQLVEICYQRRRQFRHLGIARYQPVWLPGSQCARDHRGKHTPYRASNYFDGEDDDANTEDNNNKADDSWEQSRLSVFQ